VRASRYNRSVQIFSPGANLVMRASLWALVLLIAGVSAVAYGLTRSPYLTQQWFAKEQPVPFSHEHHVEGLGIDCRYCHSSVEQHAAAGIPATSVCMNCHSQIWSDSPMLAPVRASYSSGEPLHWTRINDLPDFVYFDHSAHVSTGVGCAACHGRVDQMPLTFKSRTLFMQWCLECHRQPEKRLAALIENDLRNSGDVALSMLRGDEFHMRRDSDGLTDCVTCHR
jgi:hypothetical protein